MKTTLLFIISFTLSLYGCKNHTPNASTAHRHESAAEHASHDHEAEDHDHEAEGEGHNHPSLEKEKHTDEIIFTKAQAAKTEFEVQQIQPTTFHGVIKTSGQILPAPGDESVIVATANGIVSYNHKITEGAPVSKNQILFHISSKHLGEGDYYSKVKANYEKAKAEYERAQALIKDRIISQKEYEASRLDYENAKIAFEAISGKQSANGIGVTSPLSGHLKNILVKEGEYITIGQPLATVSQNKKLILKAEVSEKYYPKLNSIRSANFKTPYDNKVYVLSDLNGKLLSIGKASANDAFHIPVNFEFDNKGEVIPGSFAEIYLISAPIEQALTLPLTALTNEMGLFYVYVQLDEEGYRKQEVSVGMNDGKQVQILKGLHPGERVVTRGAYQVKMASASGTIPHGHSHEH